MCSELSRPSPLLASQQVCLPASWPPPRTMCFKLFRPLAVFLFQPACRLAPGPPPQPVPRKVFQISPLVAKQPKCRVAPLRFFSTVFLSDFTCSLGCLSTRVSTIVSISTSDSVSPSILSLRHLAFSIALAFSSASESPNVFELGPCVVKLFDLYL